MGFEPDDRWPSFCDGRLHFRKFKRRSVGFLAFPYLRHPQQLWILTVIILVLLTAGLVFLPHASSRTPITVYTMHMMAAAQNSGPFFEFSIERTPWTEGLFTPSLEVVEGEVAMPQGPGWGIELSREWLAGATRQVSEAGEGSYNRGFNDWLNGT